MKNFKITGLAALVAVIFSGCTNLDETVYSTRVFDNYYNNEDDVATSVLRSFEQAFHDGSFTRQFVNELPSDQIGTWGRDGWWWNGAEYAPLMYHTWDAGETKIRDRWNALFKGIGFCNSAIDDLSVLEPASVKMTREKLDYWIYQSRMMRAWYYLHALDEFRNVPLATTLDKSKFTPGQVTPQVLFDFIETELTECRSALPAKEGAGGNGKINQGMWTKAGAAALLMRLYFNAEVYIDKAMYDECAQLAQDIIDGEYGTYSLGQTWDEVFDWDNHDCPEVIFAFPGSKASNSYLYWGEIVRQTVPVDAEAYFGGAQGDFNSRWALQPGRNNAGEEYTFKLGRFVEKFKKYPADYRLIKARNLPGNSVREGMFLYEYLEYQNQVGETIRVENPESEWSKIRYELFLRDQVGEWHHTPPGTNLPDLPSNREFGDHNSGWMFTKYPLYKIGDTGEWESDYVDIRLAEVYYTLAECKLRADDVNGAATLLNSVRKRNYPESDHAAYLYTPEGAVNLTLEELQDEWGREFLAEGRRRTDLIRWGLFSSEEWWDKQPDDDDHTEIFPIPRDVLNADLSLEQNPGYTR